MSTRNSTDPARRAWPIFLFAVLVGLASLAFFGRQAWRDARLTWFARPGTCSVLSSSTYTSTTRFRSPGYTNRTSFHPRLTYQLQVDGRWYTVVGFDNMDGVTADASERLNFKAGQSYPCWYDPWDPGGAVLRRQVYKPFYLGFAIPALFLLIGGSALARVLRPVPVVTIDGVTRGEALAVRLQPELSAGKAAGCLAAAAIVCSIGVALFFAWLIREGKLLSETGLTTFALGAAAIDAFIIFHLVRAIRELRVPEPIVEIDHEPVRPGESARIFVRQRGPVKIESFGVSLVCEEQGQKGTINHHHHALMKKSGIDVAMAGDFAESMTAEIPADATPSLKELQTIVTWKIVVHRKIASGHADRDFVFRVVEGDTPRTAEP